MPFKQFLYLREVMACRSINQAAKNLFISPQALRAAIGSTEDKLGFKIFERSNQGVTLTAKGKSIEADVYAIYRMSEHWNSIREQHDGVDSIVRLVASTSICNTVMPSIMLECRSRFPNMYLQQYEARDDKLLAMLSRSRMIGVVAAAPRDIVYGQYTRFASENNYELEPLREDQFYIYINSSSPLAAKPILELSDLNRLTPAIYPEEDKRMLFKEIFNHFSQQPPFALMHQENIFQLVAEHTGIACIFPAIAGSSNRHVLSGAIVAKTVRGFPMPAFSCMFYPPKQELTNSELAVLEMIRTQVCRVGTNLSADKNFD